MMYVLLFMAPLYFSNSGTLNFLGITTFGTKHNLDGSIEPYALDPSMALNHSFKAINLSISSFFLAHSKDSQSSITIA